ncbi:sporulation protein [Streptomyces sp. NPDC005012]|uniref:sporulation protein n=1 Tax=Streptomyces sp. NPDC005012 TaxID=3154558 RepID=UPI00339EDAD5
MGQPRRIECCAACRPAWRAAAMSPASTGAPQPPHVLGRSPWAGRPWRAAGYGRARVRLRPSMPCAHGQLPFCQEIELTPAAQYTHAMRELEVIFTVLASAGSGPASALASAVACPVGDTGGSRPRHRSRGRERHGARGGACGAAPGRPRRPATCAGASRRASTSALTWRYESYARVSMLMSRSAPYCGMRLESGSEAAV